MSIPSSTSKVRAVGVCWYEGRILFQRKKTDEIWTLPTGALQGEESRQTLKLIIKDELGAEIDLGTVLYVIEHFFDRNGRSEHEVGVYYEFTFQPEFASFYEKTQFTGRSPEQEFQWVDESELNAQAIAPTILRQLLIDPPLHTQYLLEDSRKEL